MNRLLWCINRFLRLFCEYRIVDQPTLDDMTRLLQAYNYELLARMSPGECIIYNRKTCRLEIATRH
jgi:hypothetical protein